ncbi:Acyl-CoA dehydrogenase [Sphingomonas laterariae]|uniref:Acyl-CoA dehydrogenase n=1 Tax=Edaphosphingomonas laterariae TaxID=861865 RepID=A0A239HFW9_9SPHN|nr:acyl-CoA dehydrogenase family protein [Sphingomonas laterariae]SNS80257.1 Acyl-CoA dehydrogenase [Sphingomonas laterariae]
MSFIFTDEQTMLLDAATRLVEENGGSAAVRAAGASDRGYDAAVWQQMVEMGWSAIVVPEAQGGLGLGQVELSIVAAAAGRALLPSPLLSTAIAARALVLAGTPAQQDRWLPQIAAGELTATVALTGVEGCYRPGDVAATLRTDGDGYRLDGSAGFVLDGHDAGLIIVAAKLDGEIRFVAVPRGEAGLSAERLPWLDITRAAARLGFDNVTVPADAVMAGGRFADVLAFANATLAAEQMGAAAAALDITVDYAKQRVQFGQPIGAFQAVKHALADLALLVEAATSAVWYAAACADQRPEEFAEAAATAKLMASDAIVKCSADMIHYHGGIGYTWEHDAHLYFRRGRTSASLFGDADAQTKIIADAIGLGAETNDAA